MLLTKPISTFLNANRSPHIHTLLLITPTGKLLSSSSAAPASLLRNQATIACSLWELYKPLPTAGTISAALPSTSSPSSEDEIEEEEENHGPPHRHHKSSDSSSAAAAISSILIQLESGTMVIRALHCSLLFVVIGGPPPVSAAATGRSGSSSGPGLAQGVSSSPPMSSHSHTNGDGEGSAERRQQQKQEDTSSLVVIGLGGVGAATTGTSTKVVKRLAEELAKCLDGELEGFALSTGL